MITGNVKPSGSNILATWLNTIRLVIFPEVFGLKSINWIESFPVFHLKPRTLTVVWSTHATLCVWITVFRSLLLVTHSFRYKWADKKTLWLWWKSLINSLELAEVSCKLSMYNPHLSIPTSSLNVERCFKIVALRRYCEQVLPNSTTQKPKMRNLELHLPGLSNQRNLV